MGRGRGSPGRLLLLSALVLVPVGAWLAWPGPAEGPTGAPAPRVDVSPALAEATLDRFERFRAGNGGPQLSLADAELSSVLRFALPGILPPGVSEPDVRLSGSRVNLFALVATDAFPELPALDPLLGILPDTVPVRLAGELSQFGKQSLAFHVDQIEAATIPLPVRMVPEMLAALGRAHRGGLPPNALHLPLPSGIDSVFVARDSLVLVSDR